jgi:hypothetical protein
VHPDAKVTAEAHRLLKELKPDGTPKLTAEDARRRFKKITFYKSLTTKKPGTDKYYDKILWEDYKNINVDKVATYDARDYALFLVVTQVPADIYEARKNKSGGRVGGVQAEQDSMAEPGDTDAESTEDSADKFSGATHDELAAAFKKSKAEKRKLLESRKRSLEADRMKLENDIAEFSEPSDEQESEERKR